MVIPVYLRPKLVTTRDLILRAPDLWWRARKVQKHRNVWDWDHPKSGEIHEKLIQMDLTEISLEAIAALTGPGLYCMECKICEAACSKAIWFPTIHCYYCLRCADNMVRLTITELMGLDPFET